MRDNISTMVCAGQTACVEIVNTYNPYTKYIIAGVSILAVVAIGILIIYLVKRKNKK